MLGARQLCVALGLSWGLGGILAGCQPHEPQAPESLTSPDAAAAKVVKDPKAAAAKPVGEAPELDGPKAALPLPDFASIKDTRAKKGAFFSFLRPMIAAENTRTQRIRDHLKLLRRHLTAGRALHPSDQEWLLRLVDTYRVDDGAPLDQVNELLLKIHRLPEALVLAQAANESAWGTSRFAREGNNLFGQWCFSPGCGITPKARPAGDTHEVAAFPSVAASVQAYFINLNGNRSFYSLRQIRRCLLKAGEPLSGRALAAGLTAYSARGGHYVQELRSMIRHNRLEPWKTPWWGKDEGHPCASLVQVTEDKPDPLLAAQAPVSGDGSQAGENPTSASEAASPAAVAALQAPLSKPDQSATTALSMPQQASILTQATAQQLQTVQKAQKMQKVQKKPEDAQSESL